MEVRGVRWGCRASAGVQILAGSCAEHHAKGGALAVMGALEGWVCDKRTYCSGEQAQKY